VSARKDKAKVRAVAIWANLYHSKQLAVLFSRDDIREGDEVLPSILAV